TGVTQGEQGGQAETNTKQDPRNMKDGKISKQEYKKHLRISHRESQKNYKAETGNSH
ncbi:hypothetical protein ABG768_018487, partial [Culter alburnus]